MTALEQLTYTMRMLVRDSAPDDLGRIEAERQCLEAEQEQAELVAALRPFANLCDGDLSNVGGGTRLGFDGRLTADMIKVVKELLSRFPVDSAPSATPAAEP